MQRVSIGISRLRAARARWVMIQGLEKRHVVTRILQQDDMPVTRILPTSFFVLLIGVENRLRIKSGHLDLRTAYFFDYFHQKKQNQSHLI